MPNLMFAGILRNVCARRELRLPTLILSQLLLLMPALARPAAPPPAEAFGATPHVREVALSPNGTLLAWIQDDVTQENIVMFDVAANKLKRVLNPGKKAKPRTVLWVDDETLVVMVSVTAPAPDVTRQYELFRYLAADASGGPVRPLLSSDLNFNYVTGASVLSVRPEKPKTLYVSTLDFSEASSHEETGTRLSGHRKDSGWVGTLFEVDTNTGKATTLARGTPFTSDWVVNRSGHILAREEWTPGQHQYRLLAADGGGWREVLNQTDGERLSLLGPVADGSAVLALGRRGENYLKLWSIPLDGSAPKVVSEEPDRDVAWVDYDGEALLPRAVGLTGSQFDWRWLEKGPESRFNALKRAFPQSMLGWYQESRDHRTAIVRTGTPSHPDVYYIVNFTTGKADIVGEEYPALADTALGQVTRITYAARDGTVIPAFQTLPPGSSGKNLPLVVLPHGGPNSGDEYTFDWLAQFLATRGYAVLQPQFRGSTGYGLAFRKAGEHQWGGLMQDDVTDGVKALVDKGIADARHICIVGASYGGYAALAGAAFTPDLYVCAASIGGIADLPSLLGFFENQHGAESDAAAYWKINIGSASDAGVIAHSPRRAIGAIKAPILLIHAADDTVVPIAQSEAMARALQLAGKKVSLVKLPGEDHWLSRSETRIRVLKELDAFLATYLK